MFIQVIENIAGDYMLLDLATKAGERDWSVVRRLVLLPFLKIAVTFAVLQSLGTIPVSKLHWKIAVNISGISLAISFKILAGSRSGPVALLGLSLSSSLKTPSLVTDISGMAGKGWPSGIAPDKDWRQLGIYPPLFDLIGYFKF